MKGNSGNSHLKFKKPWRKEAKAYPRVLFCGILLLLISSFSGYSQSKTFKLLDRFFNDTASIEDLKWVAYPTVSYAPETSWEFGAAAVMVYYAKKDTTNRLSEASGFSFFTLQGQYGGHFEHALYSHKNEWFALGKLKLQSYPLLYYGIGLDVPSDELAIANANFTLIRERLLRRVYGHWYVGLEVDYERLSKVDFDWRDNLVPTQPILGEDGYSNLGLGFGVVYDTRHNVFNVRQGYLGEVGYLHYNPSLGSTNEVSTLFIDGRAFFKTTKRNVMAFQTIGQFSKGDVPFNQLNMIGGEGMMRGYYLGKYRDKNMFGVQAEHRWLPFKFSKKVGGSVFAGFGSVSPDLHFDKMLWTVGGGLRMLLFPRRDIFTRLDVGVNPDGYGVYLFIGEAF